MSPGAWGYARGHAPARSRDALRIQLLDEGPRARVRGKADHGRVPGSVWSDDARSARHPRAHTRRGDELARAVTGAARSRVEEGAHSHRLPASGRSHRPLAPRRAGDARLACIAGRREAATDPRPRARLHAERAIS